MHGRRVAIAAGLFSLLAPLALAQRTTGDILGTVADGTGAMLPGVAVSVSGPNIAGSQTTVTSASGVYRIGNLPPGGYSVNYSLTGFKSMALRGVRVSIGATVEQNVSLFVSQLSESVDVVAEAPVVDTTSSEVGTNFNNEWVQNAPTRRYGFYDLVAQAPGSVKAGDGIRYAEQRTMVFGGSYDANAFQLDGVNVTDTYWAEGFAEPNPDAIEEVEVLSLGAPAEYGNLMGAVYNIVTKQGTNAFHGDARVFYQSDGLTWSNTDDVKLPDGSFADACGDKRCPFTRGDYYEITAQLGGPIVKDKLWFFASYGHQLNEYTTFGVDPRAPFAPLKFKKDRYFGKLNWQISPSHRLVANFHRDHSPQNLGVDFYEAPSTAATRTQTVPAPGIAYTGTLSNRTILDVRYSGFYGNVNEYPTDPTAPRDQRRFRDYDTGLITGGHYYWYNYDARRTTLTAKLSHHADDFLGGDHDFRFGVQYNNAGVTGIYGYNDTVFSYTYNGYKYSYGYERQLFSYSGVARNIGTFADDSFRVNDRLTLNGGLRYDYSKAFAPAQDELDENKQPTGTRFPRFDHFTWNSVSPRLGLNWKPTTDGKTVLKAHYGRYHPQITTGEFTNILGPSIKPYYLGTNFNVETGTYETLTLATSPDSLRVDPNYKSPRTDQAVLALERELTRDVGLQLSYVRKWGRDFPGWQETAGTYAMVPIVDDAGEDATGKTINVFQLQTDPGARRFQITNRAEVRTDVHAVSGTLTKRMTSWFANAGVTWLRASGLAAESYGASISQRSTLAFSRFGRNPNDYVNKAGRLPGDVTWQFKLQFVWQLPAGFLFSTNVDHRTGAHRTRTRFLSSALTGGIPNYVTLSPRGTVGRLPTFTMVDARIQKDFKLGGNKRISVFADMLNLTNENSPQAVRDSIVGSATYQYPDSFPFPRRVMIGAKAGF
jgi:outer membrane receptor protein involved in Fe transport